MTGRLFDGPFGKGAGKVTAALAVLAGLILSTWVFAGESTGRSLDPGTGVVEKTGERAREQNYRHAWVQGLTPGNGFAGMYLTRVKKKVKSIEFLGPCGANYAGPTRIKGRKFRTTGPYRGGGWRISGTFSKNGKRIKGKLRSWSKGCDTGTLKFIMKKA